jgi:TPR repeat protein
MRRQEGKTSERLRLQRASLVALLGLASGCATAAPSAPAASSPVVDVGDAIVASAPGPETCRLEDEAACEQLCTDGDAESCTRLARLRLRHVGEDRKRASDVLKLFRRACTSGSARGCNGVGVMHQRGLAVAKDVHEAMRWYRKACDEGYSGGCYNLGQLYRFGQGVGSDLQLAAQLYGEACRMSDGDACAALGTLHADGSVPDASPERARDLFRRACQANVARGCHNLAMLKLRADSGRSVSHPEVSALLRRACKLGSEESCKMMQTGPGTGEPLGD